MKQKLKRIIDLVNMLNYNTKQYDLGKPLITDKEWDRAYFELENLEKETGLILSNSPTQTIVYELKTELSKSTHNHKMLSLDKTKSISEAVNFVKNQLFLTMCKMDGLTCSLTYRNGELVSAETRGNGMVGEDILHNARVLPSIPKNIPYLDELVIDGEIICRYKDFEPFSNEYKNPRNFAAGSIRLLDAKECANRNLTFVAWDVISKLYFEDEIEYRVDQKLSLLATFGFTIVPYHVHKGEFMNDKIMEVFINDMTIMAKEYSYPIDGVVFKYADCEYGRSLGETTHHFKNALAFKFYDETYPTTLIDIEYTMGRTGVLTPVAVFEPIDIDGSTVERASLHNLSIMEELSGGFERKGDTLYIFKANQIIPQVDKWEHSGEYNEEIHISIPEVCPVCGGETGIKMDNDSKMLVCKNPNCAGKLINRLDHFCGKKGLDIKGLSKATLEKLIDWGWVNSCKDLFTLHEYRDEWIKKPGFGVKSVEKVLSAIDSARICDMDKYIASLGIPLIGSTASKELGKVFSSWNDFIIAAEGNYHFYDIPNFGAEMNSAIHNFNYSEAKFIADNYINFAFKIDMPESRSETTLADKTFVITGKLKHFKNRDEIKSKIESLGGKVTGSVSKKTDYLINNDKDSTSSKNETAKSLNIPILSEEDFIATFGIMD